MPSRIDGLHQGEAAVRAMLKAPPLAGDAMVPGLPARSAMRVVQSPLMALGTLDDEGRPWTTVWGGERGFAQPVAEDILGIKSDVDVGHDPVFKAMWKGAEEAAGGVVQPERMMSALAIDLETRDRMKLAGIMVAGAKAPASQGDSAVAADDVQGVQMAMHVTESLGNCPKYLNKKKIAPRAMRPELASEGLPLAQEAVSLIRRADLFFMSTTDYETMDTNHRGGPPGFVRVKRNDDGGTVLVYPEYSGNRLYQSLGNLKVNPRIGVVFPDFETADALFVTGTASILVGEDASSLLSRTKVALEITVTSARFVKSCLPFRGSFIDYSPYNPPLRLLHTEHDSHTASSASGPALTASLVSREVLTPTIARFRFRLSSERQRVATGAARTAPRWQAGQYVTLDFGRELDNGYAHMNDGDPQSLNDDYVRTFTVSSAPVRGGDDGGDEVSGDGESEFEITARKHGPATGFLWRRNMQVPLELPVLGFGGEEDFQMLSEAPSHKVSGPKAQPVYIAAGVGVTPLLAQAQAVLDKGMDLQVLWSVRVDDLPLAADAFKRIQGLAAVTKLLVTGSGGAAAIEDLQDNGLAAVERRRMAAGDVEKLKRQGRKFFLCTNPVLLGMLNGWLAGEDVAFEDFGY